MTTPAIGRVQNKASELVSKGLGERANWLASFLQYNPSDSTAQRILAGGIAVSLVTVCAAVSYVVVKNGGVKIIIEAAKDEAGS